MSKCTQLHLIDKYFYVNYFECIFLMILLLSWDVECSTFTVVFLWCGIITFTEVNDLASSTAGSKPVVNWFLLVFDRMTSTWDRSPVRLFVFERLALCSVMRSGSDLHTEQSVSRDSNHIIISSDFPWCTGPKQQLGQTADWWCHSLIYRWVWLALCLFLFVVLNFLCLLLFFHRFLLFFVDLICVRASVCVCVCVLRFLVHCDLGFDLWPLYANQGSKTTWSHTCLAILVGTLTEGGHSWDS